MELKEAIKVAKKECKDLAAQAYLKALPDAIEEYGTHGFNVQLLYVLTNMQYWRGENAKAAKLSIRTHLISKGMLKK